MKKWLVASGVVLSALPIFGATFVVPPDEILASKAEVIVEGEVLTTYSRYGAAGRLETVTEISVSDSIKGLSQPRIQVVHPGGRVGDVGMILPGVPVFEPGDRVLLFLMDNGRGDLTTVDLALGKFEYVKDRLGRLLAIRQFDEIGGWDLEGKAHVERHRGAVGFKEFIRATSAGVRSEADYFLDMSDDEVRSISSSVTVMAGESPNDYTFDFDGNGVRWNNFASTSQSFFVRNGQIGITDGGVDYLQQALAAWTDDCDSLIKYEYGGVDATARGNGNNPEVDFDGVNGVVFNDVFNDIPGSFNCATGGTLGIGGPWYGGTHTLAGDTMFTILEGNVTIQDGVECWLGLNDGRFIQLLIHELGHSLGFRHSDEPAAGQSPNTPAAIMKASISQNFGSTLQQYDKDAAMTVYPGGSCTVCTGPTINTQPASVTIDEGNATMLSVAATASEGTLSHQWYQGTSGVTTTPVGTNSATLNVSPTTTTSYWVRVSDGCGTTPSVDSNTATVTVTPAVVTPQVTSVTPNFGPDTGGTAVAITGSNFENGATVSFGGTAATGVVFVDSTALTATTPAHTAGLVAVTVVNPGGASGTRNSAFTYQSADGTPGDSNGDNAVTVTDIFYLINFIFASGPAPVADGDANGDGNVTVTDIFYLINFIFAGGPPPVAATTGGVSASSIADVPSASISIGNGIVRRGQSVVRVPIRVEGAVVDAVALRVTTSSTAVREIRVIPTAGGIFHHAVPGARSASFVAARRNATAGAVGDLEIVLARALEQGETIEIRVDRAISGVGSIDGRPLASSANGALMIHDGVIVTPAEVTRPSRRR